MDQATIDALYSPGSIQAGVIVEVEINGEWVDVSGSVISAEVDHDVDANGPAAQLTVDRSAAHPDGGGWAVLARPVQITGWVERDGQRIERRLVYGRVGEVDTVAQAMTVVVYDRSEELLNRWIREPHEHDGRYLIRQLQQILDQANVDLTVWSATPENEQPYVKAYRQRPMTVWDALNDLAMQYGWRVEWRWVDGEWRLTLYQPDRSRRDPDYTLAADTWLTVGTARRALTEVRNVVRVVYGPPGNALHVEVGDQDSIDKYGTRWMRIDQPTPSPLAAAQAEALAQAVLDDLHEPLAEVEVTLRWAPWIELRDMIELRADGHTLLSSLTVAVTGWRHTIRAGEVRTTINARGINPPGQYKRWLKRERGRYRVDTPAEIVHLPNRLLDAPLLKMHPKLRGLQLTWSLDLALYDQYDHTEIKLDMTEYPSQMATWGITRGSGVYITHLGDGTPLTPGTRYYAAVRHVYRDGQATPWSAVMSAIAGTVAVGDGYAESNPRDANITNYSNWTDVPGAEITIPAGDAVTMILGFDALADVESSIGYDSSQDTIDIYASIEVRISGGSNLSSLEGDSRRRAYRRVKMGLDTGQSVVTSILNEFVESLAYSSIESVTPGDTYTLKLQAKTTIVGTGTNLSRAAYLGGINLWAVMVE